MCLCVKQISSRFSTANVSLPSLPVLPHHYRTCFGFFLQVNHKNLMNIQLLEKMDIRWLRIKSTGTQVRGKLHFHKALAIVRPAPDWPTLVVYKAVVTSEQDKKEYIGLTEHAFKQRYSSHQSSFRHQIYEQSTELSKHIWSLKKKDGAYTIEWEICEKAPAYTNKPKSANCA